MGTACILVNEAVRKRILSEPVLLDLVRVLKQTDWGEGLTYMQVSSPLIPHDNAGEQNIILEGDKVRFKPALDV